MLIKKSDPRQKKLIFNALVGGGIVIMACDTIYGFVGVSGDTDDRIRTVKRRRKGKPFIALMPDLAWLPRFTDVFLPEKLKAYWPGPLTLIVPAKQGGTIALRIPRDSTLRWLLRRIDRTLNSTSVNVEGQTAMHKIADIIPAFESHVDLVVDSGDLDDGEPSTMLDLSQSPYRIVRQGALSIDLEAIQEDR